MYFLGIDTSTTSSKALLVDESGQVRGVASAPHSLQTPRPLWSEQDPTEWWGAVCLAIRAVMADTGVTAEQIGAVGLTGQMHGLVILDVAGQVIRPAILWNDQRTSAECDLIHERIGREKFISITGNVALTGFTAPKILWVARNEPEAYRRIAHILLPKDYIRYRMSGEYAMDKADGAGTVLFDLKKRDWSAEVAAALDIRMEWLPRTFEGTEVTSRVSAQAAEACGLKAGTPIVAGGGDQAAGAVGVGAVEAGIVALTVGTSGVVFAPTSAPLIEPDGRLHAFCHAAPGLWHFMGVMLSAAGSLQWYRDTLTPGMPFDDLLAEAVTVPAGAEGLQFMPYLSGERTPYPDPLARGGFVGLTLRHGRGHMTRAVLEGVAYGLKDSFELIRSAGSGPVTQVRASGGGTKGKLWREIMASVLGVELVTVNTAEGGAFGAALLAGVAGGCWPDVQSACRAAVHVTGQTLPSDADRQVYEQGYAIFKELYPTLKPVFHQMR